jgi:hypothetical protein
MSYPGSDRPGDRSLVVAWAVATQFVRLGDEGALVSPILSYLGPVILNDARSSRGSVRLSCTR